MEPALIMQSMQELVYVASVLDQHVDVETSSISNLFTGVLPGEAAAGAGARHARRVLQARSDGGQGAPDAAQRLDAGRDLGRHALGVEVDQHPCRHARLVVDEVPRAGDRARVHAEVLLGHDRGRTGKTGLQGSKRYGLIGAAGRNVPGKIVSRRGDEACRNTFSHPALRPVAPQRPSLVEEDPLRQRGVVAALRDQGDFRGHDGTQVRQPVLRGGDIASLSRATFRASATGKTVRPLKRRPTSGHFSNERGLTGPTSWLMMAAIMRRSPLRGCGSPGDQLVFGKASSVRQRTPNSPAACRCGG